MLRDGLRSLIIRTGSNRYSLRTLYYMWRILPYPVRKIGTALFIINVLSQKKLFRVDQQNELTPENKLGILSFWGVPEIDLDEYRLLIEGAVTRPISLTFQEICSLPSVKQQVRMDCVGGFRNNSVMQGVSLTTLLGPVEIGPDCRRAVFHCADGYHVALDIQDLRDREAFLAYSWNDQDIPQVGFPLRLAIPGKYGYHWAKWVVRIELVTDQRKGHWPSLGLPDRGDVGDVW